MPIEINCPRCNHEFDLLSARDDDDWRLLMEAILTLPPVTHRSLWAYLGLFKGKNKLRSSKMLRVVKQLAPMIKAAQVERNANTYAVPPTQFASAMEYMVDSPPASLVLPLKSNGYLLSVLANTAETALQKAEQLDAKKKNERYRDFTNTEVHTREPAPAPAPRQVSKSVPQALKDMVGLRKKQADDLTPKQSTNEGDDNA